MAQKVVKYLFHTCKGIQCTVHIVKLHALFTDGRYLSNSCWIFSLTEPTCRPSENREAYTFLVHFCPKKNHNSMNTTYPCQVFKDAMVLAPENVMPSQRQLSHFESRGLTG